MVKDMGVKRALVAEIWPRDAVLVKLDTIEGSLRASFKDILLPEVT
jgi:hypothetical protein